jgi:glutamyl/glutaminyl-tRNA synthetase
VAYGQAPALAAAVLDEPDAPPALADAVDAAGPRLEQARAQRAAAAEWLDPEAARELLAGYRAWGKQRGIGARDLLMPLRIALTGAEHGPELPFVLAALPRDVALRRLDAALHRLNEDLAGNSAGESTTNQGDPT